MTASSAFAPDNADGGRYGLGRRHVQVFLLFLAISMAYALRINLSIGIVAMNAKKDELVDDQGFPLVHWDSSTRGYILSSFFWGYVVTQVPAGMLANRFGPKRFLLAAVFGCSTLAIIMPKVAQWGGWQTFCALRTLQGLFQGMIFPSAHTMLGRWVPLTERGRASATVYGGSSLGTVATMAVSGWLARTRLGWPSIYYLPGAFGIVWSVAWFWLAADSPGTCTAITTSEREYIEKGLGSSSSGEERHSVPWKSILTSLPMWSLIVVHCGQNFGHWVLLTQMPTYMDEVLDFAIDENGLFSSLPYLALWIATFVFGWASQFVNERQVVSLVASRKIFNSIGHWGSAMALVILATLPDVSATGAVALLTATVSLEAGTLVGFFVNHIDLSPNFGGAMMGVTNGVSNIMGIVSPLIVTRITNPEDIELSHLDKAARWDIVFYLAAGIYFAGNLFFVLAGKAEVQTWNKKPGEKLEEKKPYASSETIISRV